MISTWKHKAAAVAVAFGCIGGAALAQTPVRNPGFEDAIIYDTAPTLGVWTAFFGGPPASMLAAAQDTTAPRNGANALFVKVAVEANSFAGVQQPINGIQPGVSYTFGIWARSAGPVNNGVEYRIEWKNAAGGFIGDQFGLTTRIDSALTPAYQQFNLTAVSPPNAASANLVIAVQSFAFNPVTPVFDTNVYFDDATFSADSLPTQAACCFPDGSCSVALLNACPAGTTQRAAGTTCSPNGCPAPMIGACCNPTTGACIVLDAAICNPLGTFRGAGTTCSPGFCPIRCAADFNGVDGITVNDIFDFLAAWFTGCP
jgi:hypothetical protein